MPYARRGEPPDTAVGNALSMRALCAPRIGSDVDSRRKWTADGRGQRAHAIGSARRLPCADDVGSHLEVAVHVRHSLVAPAAAGHSSRHERDGASYFDIRGRYARFHYVRRRCHHCARHRTVDRYGSGTAVFRDAHADVRARIGNITAIRCRPCACRFAPSRAQPRGVEMLARSCWGAPDRCGTWTCIRYPRIDARGIDGWTRNCNRRPTNGTRPAPCRIAGDAV